MTDVESRRNATKLTTFNQVFDRQNLLRSYFHILRTAGTSEPFIEELSRSVLEGDYVSSLPPKPQNKTSLRSESRRLPIHNVRDLVVARTLYRSFSPRFEKLFMPNSHGFRPDRSPATLLANLVCRMEADQRWFLAIDDIRDAYRRVRVADVIEAHARMMVLTKFPRSMDDQGRFLEVLWQVLVLGKPNRKVGIGWSSPYSQLALNALLHFELDMRGAFQKGYFRHGDSILYAGQSEKNCQQFLEVAETFLDDIRLELEGEQPRIVDLRQDTATVLGFCLDFDAHRVSVTLREERWRDLKDDLVEAHHYRDPLRRFFTVLKSWLCAWAPGFDPVATTSRRLLTVIRDAELPNRFGPELIERAVSAHLIHWKNLCQSVRVNGHG